jgi:hypothetical protein
MFLSRVETGHRSVVITMAGIDTFVQKLWLKVPDFSSFFIPGNQEYETPTIYEVISV